MIKVTNESPFNSAAATPTFLADRHMYTPVTGQVNAAIQSHRLREALLGHRGAVVWLTGLSGAGKSTLASALSVCLLRAGVLSMIVDGDTLRQGLCRDLGFSTYDRQENVRRAAETAVLMAESGAVVIAALISPFRKDRHFAASRCEACGVPYAEVYVNAPLAVCERRDPKRLYWRARSREIDEFTGISSPYEAPTAPALELRTDHESVGSCVGRLLDLAFTLAVRHGQSWDGAEI